MLDRSTIAKTLEEKYRIHSHKIVQLSVGADSKSYHYKVTSHSQETFYVKVRAGENASLAIRVINYLSENGLSHILTPLTATDNTLWIKEKDSIITVFPYKDGINGFDTELTERQFVSLGQTLKNLHSLLPSVELNNVMPRETFSSSYREKMRMYLMENSQDRMLIPIALKFIKAMNEKAEIISSLLSKAELLSQELERTNVLFVFCHGDIHAGNIFISEAKELFIVDWDTAVFAPKEKDLMFIGGGIGGTWNTKEEEHLFYQGYGNGKINKTALAYYRHERIIEDCVAFYEQILLREGSEESKEKALVYFMSQFDEGNVVERALAT